LSWVLRHRIPAVLLSRLPAVLLSRPPAVLLSRPPAVLRNRLPAVLLHKLPSVLMRKLAPPNMRCLLLCLALRPLERKRPEQDLDAGLNVGTQGPASTRRSDDRNGTQRSHCPARRQRVCVSERAQCHASLSAGPRAKLCTPSVRLNTQWEIPGGWVTPTYMSVPLSTRTSLVPLNTLGMPAYWGMP